MLDSSNLINISGGIVQEPERVNDNIIKFRIGVDYAGNERNSENNSGYFDVTYFTSNGGSNAEFVVRQLNDGNLKVGSQITIIGRLVQERWTAPEGNRSRVVIVAEHIGYAKGTRKPDADSDEAPRGQVSANASSSGNFSQAVPDAF